MFPKKMTPILFGFFVSGLMSLVVSGVSTYLSVGGIEFGLWSGNWITSWAIAFPTILFVAPLVRKFLTLIVRQD